MNTEGLAYDWVAGFNHPNYKPAPEMVVPRGNPSARMLESCRTVSEAVQFYKKHAEPSFAYARLMIADRAGASVIIGARNGNLEFVEATECRGFGYGRKVVDHALKTPPAASLSNGVKILQEARQDGEFATKYSNVFDLRSGRIFIYPDIRNGKHYLIDIAEELKKGGNYYDIPAIGKQMLEPPISLPSELKRFFLDEFEPSSFPDTALATRIKRLIMEAYQGKPNPADYDSALWAKLPPAPEMQSQVRKLGAFIALQQVDSRKYFVNEASKKAAGERTVRFKMEYEKGTALHRFTLNQANQVTAMRTEGFEGKPGSRLE
ncbi:MAG: hypothetical protein ACO1QB_11170 [Verrucomicrobiales bacterium]